MGQIESSDSAFIIQKINQVLANLQPYIQSHGGRVEFVTLQESVVFIRFHGACVSCPLSFYTVTHGIERHIKQAVPSVTRVQVLED